MALKVTITFSDNPDSGTFEMKADPPMAQLYERIKTHGIQSLSGAEYGAMSAFAHVMRTVDNAEERSSLILPDKWKSFSN